MNKRIRVVTVCFILLLLAAFLRIQLTYVDKSDHHGRGPPSVLINSDTRELAAEKRYIKFFTDPQMYFTPGYGWSITQLKLF